LLRVFGLETKGFKMQCRYYNSAEIFFWTW